METRQLLTLWLTLSVSVPGTGSPPPTVNGALGHSVSLPPGIPVGPDVAEVWWSRTSPRTRIVKYSKGHIEYSGTEYKRRVTLHPGNFSLEIRDLRREDAGDYEVDVTASSGAENKTTVRLEVSAATGSPPPTVNGALGHSVSLPPGIPVGPDVAEVQWMRISPRTRIVKYSKGHIEYAGAEEYKRRVTLHPGDFSLEIRDLRREDTGDYEVDVTASSGAENKTTVRLEVSEPVSGTHITVQNITETCNLTLTCSVTSGDLTSFRWWRGGEAVANDTTHHLWEHGEMLEIHHTAEVEDVVYRCEARNPVSEGTAQIRLWDVCKLHKPHHNTKTLNTTTTLLIVLAVLVTFLICALTVILLVIRRRRAAGREMSSDTEDPVDTGTVYADLRLSQNHHANRQPPVGNKRCVGLEVSAENPATEYAAVVYRATPHPGFAEVGARRQRPAV
ncbi:SLAM family member 5-like isoform X1 [Pristis pectinata]|uniref:SLAM family member 5-like isoform X1 n=1 Tax=Pristis pectinata TaxID=685728 RepID=UPI00223CDC9A|nr:SLAM family member 5-like isoform X1 [Pristis pectinata]